MASVQAPKCFNNEAEFTHWQKLARQSHHNQTSFCKDCTPEYQKEMVSTKRCAHPLVQFRRFKDDGIQGYY
jgi:hypothetical protein